MKRRRLYDLIFLICILCLFCGIIYYNRQDSVPEASEKPSIPSEEHGPWNVEYILKNGVPHKLVPTIFLKGQSKSGVDVLLTIERLPNGEVIQITCPIPDMPPIYDLFIFVSKDHCCILEYGELPEDCCLTRVPWGADVHAQKVKGKGYIFTIAPKDVGMLLSHLTDAQTLWVKTYSGRLFTFRVAGFSKFYDQTLHE